MNITLLDAMAGRKLEVLGTPVEVSGLSAAKNIFENPPVGTIAAMVTVNTKSIRYCMDNAVPTSTVGHLVEADKDPAWFPFPEKVLRKIKAIETAASADLYITYLGVNAG